MSTLDIRLAAFVKLPVRAKFEPTPGNPLGVGQVLDRWINAATVEEVSSPDSIYRPAGACLIQTASARYICHLSENEVVRRFHEAVAAIYGAAPPDR